MSIFFFYSSIIANYCTSSLSYWLPSGYLRYYMFGKLMGICNNVGKLLFSLEFRIVLLINMA